MLYIRQNEGKLGNRDLIEAICFHRVTHKIKLI